MIQLVYKADIFLRFGSFASHPRISTVKWGPGGRKLLNYLRVSMAQTRPIYAIFVVYNFEKYVYIYVHRHIILHDSIFMKHHVWLLKDGSKPDDAIFEAMSRTIFSKRHLNVEINVLSMHARCFSYFKTITHAFMWAMWNQWIILCTI